MAIEGLDITTPASARIYDYLGGGKDNFAPDREVGDKVKAASPYAEVTVRANRRFMARSARYLAHAKGIRQFLDVGTGIPTKPNLHEVVQGVDPTSLVVYVDNDPIVLVHARALLKSNPQGRTAYIDADMYDPKAILNDAAFTDAIDLSRPVAVTLVAVLHHVTDDDVAAGIAATLMAPMPSGSALVISATTIDNDPTIGAGGLKAYRSGGVPVRERTRAQVQALFGGLPIEDPGVTLVHRWRPDDHEAGITDEQVFMYGGVAIKP